MKEIKFIKLHEAAYMCETNININLLVYFQEVSTGGAIVGLLSSCSIYVIETPQQIIDLIKEAQNESK